MSTTTCFAACALMLSPALFAQVQQPGQLPDPNSSASSPKANSEPLSVGEKYRVALNRSVDPFEFLRIAAGAAINQARNYPSEWGQGWDAFGVRVASGFGQQLVRGQIEFGVWAIDREDPRHRPSQLHGAWPRTKYAIIHTFVAQRDNGGAMPAYSRFVGDYGADFVRHSVPTHSVTLHHDVLGLACAASHRPHHRIAEADGLARAVRQT